MLTQNIYVYRYTYRADVYDNQDTNTQTSMSIYLTHKKKRLYIFLTQTNLRTMSIWHKRMYIDQIRFLRASKNMTISSDRSTLSILGGGAGSGGGGGDGGGLSCGVVDFLV